MIAIAPHSSNIGLFVGFVASVLMSPLALAQLQPLDVSAVRFISANQAEFIYEIDFGPAGLAKTFAVQVGAGASLPADFARSRRVHITENATTESEPHPQLVKDALVSFSVTGPNPVTSGIYQITVRGNAAANGKTIRFSYVATDVSIANAYRVVPDAKGLNTASICAIINIQNSSKSNWGPTNGTFLLGGHGIPEATTVTPKYQVIGAVPAGGTIAQAAICDTAKEVLHKRTIDLSGLPDIKQKAAISHPEVTLKLLDWPKAFQLLGQITIEGQGIRVPPPILSVTGTSDKDKLKSFKKNQEGTIALELDSLIHVQKADSFPANIEVDDGVISYHEVRKIKFENKSKNSRTVHVKADKNWGVIKAIPDKPAPSPTMPQVISGSTSGHNVLELREKQKAAQILKTMLQPTTSINGEIQRIVSGLKEIRLLQVAGKTEHFGAYSATATSRQEQMESVEIISESMAMLETFFKSCTAKTTAVEKAIQTELARHPYPRPISDQLQQELDATLRELRSRRDKVDGLLARATEQYNQSVRKPIVLNLKALEVDLAAITDVITPLPKPSITSNPPSIMVPPAPAASTPVTASMVDLGELKFTSKWLIDGKAEKNYALSGLTFAQVGGQRHLLAIQDKHRHYGGKPDYHFLFEISLQSTPDSTQKLTPVITQQTPHLEVKDFEGVTFGLDERGQNRLFVCSEGSQPSIEKMKLVYDNQKRLNVQVDPMPISQIPGVQAIFTNPADRSWEGILRTSDSLILVPESSNDPQRQLLALQLNPFEQIWFSLPESGCNEAEFSGACLLARQNATSDEFIAILERNNGDADISESRIHIVNSATLAYQGSLTLNLKLPDGIEEVKGYSPEGIAALPTKEGWTIFLVNDPTKKWYQPISKAASISSASQARIDQGVPLLFQGELKKSQLPPVAPSAPTNSNAVKPPETEASRVMKSQPTPASTQPVPEATSEEAPPADQPQSNKKPLKLTPQK